MTALAFPRLSVLFSLALAVSIQGCATDPGASGTDGGVSDAGQPPGQGDPCEVAQLPTGDDANCPVTVTYRPPHAAKSVALAGEWNGFSASSLPLSGPAGDGSFSGQVRLPPGVYAYKIVVDGTEWHLDEGNSYRKYVSGTENSGLRVADCHRPSLRLVPGSLHSSRSAPGKGDFSARVQVIPAVGRPPGLCHVKSSLRQPSTHKSTGASLPPLDSDALGVSADGTALELHLHDLPDGKYTLSLQPSAGGQDGPPLLLPFWIEPEKFSFSDTPLYMAVTDRFANGDPGNDHPMAGVQKAANYQGGDLAGVTQKIEAGYFDLLGVRALWLTPFYSQPDAAYLDASNMYDVAPYHGYWPVKARTVDVRLGGDEALHTLVETAHRHGIRVLMDSVLNHVHDQHEYFQDPAKKGWFRTGCICGTTGCDWTEKRLECLFAPYMPDINWTVTAASDQFISDALWWLEEFDLDGLRIDAVKHVEDLAILNLGTQVRERFEQAGTHYYLLGETAMGWNDGTVADNAENYDTIKRYIGPDALDGQFDFVWYHGIAYRVFAYDEKRFIHLDYWTEASLDQFQGALMVDYLGSHDTSRFVTLSTYRDSSGMWSRDKAFNKWTDLPLPPPDGEAYDRLWLGMLSIMTLPGMPLLYYGDEYGEYGGGDPDNRHFMRFGDQLAPREAAQEKRMSALLRSRASSRGLRRGPMQTVLLGDDVYAYARLDPEPSQVVLVVLNRLATASTTAVPIPPELGWKAGDRLQELLGGAGYTVSGTLLNVTVPPRSGILLALSL